MSQPTCILCAFYRPHAEPHPPEHGWLTCPAGQRRLEHELLSIRASFLRLLEEVTSEVGAKDAVSIRLPSATTPSPSNQPHVSGTAERQLPINTDRIDLILPVVPGYVRDPRRDQVGHLSVATVLNEWVAEWHDQWCAEQSYPHTVAVDLLAWILPRLDQICRQEPALADFADEMGAVRSRLQAALGELKKKSVTMWGIACPRCNLVSQLKLDPEDPDQYRECSNCGLLLSKDEYLQHLRDLVDGHRSS